MTSIAHTGFGSLFERFSLSINLEGPVVFSEVPPIAAQTDPASLDRFDLLLIGPLAVDAVRQAQRAGQHGPCLSVIIFAFNEQVKIVRQSFQLAVNPGRNIIVVPLDISRDYSSTLQNAALKTRQRLSFKRLGTGVPALATRSSTGETDAVSLLMNSFYAVITLDPLQRITGMNDAARELLRREAESAEPMMLADIFTSYQLLPSREPDGQKILRPFRRGARSFLADVAVIPQPTQYPGWILIIRETTVQISEQTESVSKLEELQFLHDELDQFIDVVSHDFRTPLTAISAISQLALTEPDPDKARQLMARIGRSTDVMKELLAGMATLVNLKRGKTEKKEVIDLLQRVHVSWSQQEASSLDPKAELITDFSGVEDFVYYKSHIDVFLGNLINNSIRYKSGSRPLRLVARGTREDGYVRISVKDNGRGIDLKRHMSKLFQPFRRISDLSSGAGLGLSIVKRMIEHQQGYIEVSSEPDQGTEIVGYFRNLA